MSRFCDTRVAVMVLLRKKNMVLLQKRMNTGYMDGYWDFSATGHVESGESMKCAGVRETLEEINVKIKQRDLKIITMMHKFTRGSDLTYMNGFFECFEYDGVIQINETDKISELKWFDINDLPKKLIPDRLLALETEDEYIEIGW